MMMKNQECLNVHHGADVAVFSGYAYDELSAKHANMDVTTQKSVSMPFLQY